MPEGRRARLFDWYWKDPAPWQEITTYAAQLPEVYIQPLISHEDDDPYGLIVASYYTTLDEEQQIIATWRAERDAEAAGPPA
jgi:hypothetical protein